MPLYPLRFKEILRNYNFGDRWIVQAFEKGDLPVDHRVAETWEVCDRPGESSLVTNGSLAGSTLHDLIERDPAPLLGIEIVERFEKRFPLLIKLLDVSFQLGEQVHHSDELAARRNLKDPGKTEAWYMLRTRSDAMIHCGQMDNRVSKEKLRAALREGNIKDLMRPYPVQPGDSFLLYAGTMHYSPGGVLFYEIMQNSDVYIGLREPDANLSPSERQKQIDEILEGIHLEDGFECKTVPVHQKIGGNQRSFVLACQHFALEKLDLQQPYSLYLDGRHFHVLTVIAGVCKINAVGQDELLLTGQSCLLPSILGRITLQPRETCSVLDAYVPDLVYDVITPLQKAGISNEAIARLGGHTRLNPLPDLLTRE